MLATLKKWLEDKQDPNHKKMKPIHYFIILLGVGLGFMVFTDFLTLTPEQTLDSNFQVPTSTKQTEPPTLPTLGNVGSNNDLIREYENAYETQLEEILQAIVGVGRVEVMVNLDSTPEIVVEKNRDMRQATTKEKDKDNATRDQSDQSRNEQVVVISGSKSEQPVVVKTMKPKVRGVLVVAKGVENIQVKAWMTEAVQKVLDVPAYKISILPKKG